MGSGFGEDAHEAGHGRRGRARVRVGAAWGAGRLSGRLGYDDEARSKQGKNTSGRLGVGNEAKHGKGQSERARGWEMRQRVLSNWTDGKGEARGEQGQVGEWDSEAAEGRRCWHTVTYRMLHVTCQCFPTVPIFHLHHHHGALILDSRSQACSIRLRCSRDQQEES